MRRYPALLVTPPPAMDAEMFDGLLLAALVDAGVSAVDADTASGAARVFFFTPEARDASRHAVLDALPGAGVTAADIDDEDWAARSQAAIAAVTVDGITVAPPWDRPASTDGVVVVIQPSTGFGTAHHESTRLCLRLLQAAPVHGLRVLDVGTGSGVLALAARLSGAGETIAADFDADALENAAENRALNGLAEDDVRLLQLDLFDAASLAAIEGRVFDVVFANLTGGLLAAQAGTIARWVAPGGRLIVSGVMLDEEAAVTQAVVDTGLTPGPRLSEREWAGLSWTR